MNAEDLLKEFANLDTHRHQRSGFVEAIFCDGKTHEQVASIVEMMISKGHNVLGTRASKELSLELKKRFDKLDYDEQSKVFRIINNPIKQINGRLAVLAAGTADVRVAEEAKRVAEFYGIEAKSFYDVGVAGLHRLLSNVKELDEFDCLIVVAGMEGALPSVIGGLTGKPVIAVPTSVGYGANFGGITPLLAMLNSCSEGITVVNIDNGFGAACAAIRILSLMNKK